MPVIAPRLLLVVVAGDAPPTTVDLTSAAMSAAVLAAQIDQIERSMARDGLGQPDWLKRLRTSLGVTGRQLAARDGGGEADFGMVRPVQRILTTRDVADLLGVSVSAAQRHLRSTPGVFRVGRSLRITLEDFERQGHNRKGAA